MRIRISGSTGGQTDSSAVFYGRMYVKTRDQSYLEMARGYRKKSWISAWAV